MSFRKTPGPYEVYEGTDCSQVIELVTDDCIQRLDLLFNADGDAVQIGYRRRNGKVEQFAGYSEGIKAQTAVQFGAEGCMSGYELAFKDVASSRRLLADSPQTLRGMVAVANPDATA